MLHIGSPLFIRELVNSVTAQFNVHLFHMLLACFNSFSNSLIVADLATKQLSQFFQRNPCHDTTKILLLFRFTISKIMNDSRKASNKAFVYVGLTGVLQQNRIYDNAIDSADAMHTPYTLLQDHWVPRQIEMDQMPRYLKIDSFTASGARYEDPTAEAAGAGKIIHRFPAF